MLVFHVATELSPIAKVGGLGDVVYGLSKELVKLGHHLHVILPRYGSLDFELLREPVCFLKKVFSFNEEPSFKVSFWKASYENLSLILIDPEPPKQLFRSKNIYGEPDDIDRFLLFSFLTLDYLATKNFPPSILHLHDWPSSFVAPLYKQLYAKKFSMQHKLILTIHNVLHQGRCLPHHLKRFGIEKNSYLEDPFDKGLVNLLKGGIIYSDHVVAVSPTYANEIKTKEFGYHLDPVLAACGSKLSGILNGIDLDYWNPRKDNALAELYPSSDKIPNIVEAKTTNKACLRQRFHLKFSDAPLFGCVTRLDRQKGPDLIAHSISTILEKGGQCVLLGSSMDPSIQEQFKKIKHLYTNNPNFHFQDTFDESLARLIYAASDFMIIPSLFEPCGLTQMIAMRYYTIPIVRITGGLADTVHDKIGISFKEISTEQLDCALIKAFALYQEKPQLFSMLHNLSSQDFSWRDSAKKYLKIYDH